MTSYVRVLGFVAFGVTSAMALSACVVRAQARPGVYVTPTASATVVAQPTYVQPQPTYVQPQPTYVAPQPVYARPACGACQQGSFERCNGCDDNCNGVIDEDCR